MPYSKVPAKRKESDLLLSKEIDIQAPMDIVFDVLTDFELFVDLEEPVQSATITSEIKQGKGVTSHWKLLDPDTGEAWYLDEEILSYDYPEQYAYTGVGSNGNDYTGVHNLSRNADGSTHVLFNEVFHFDADPAVYGEVLDTLLANVKIEAEKRAGK